MEAMVSTLNPNFRKVASMLDEVAPVRHYSSYFCQYSSKYEALKRGEIASSFKPGTAGALRDIGVYTLYPMVALFGRPSVVRSELRTVRTAEGDADVQGTAYLGYDEMDATLTWSKVYDSFQPTEIAGEKGNLIPALDLRLKAQPSLKECLSMNIIMNSRSSQISLRKVRQSRR